VSYSSSLLNFDYHYLISGVISQKPAFLPSAKAAMPPKNPYQIALKPPYNA